MVMKEAPELMEGPYVELLAGLYGRFWGGSGRLGDLTGAGRHGWQGWRLVVVELGVGEGVGVVEVEQRGDGRAFLAESWTGSCKGEAGRGSWEGG